MSPALSAVKSTILGGGIAISLGERAVIEGRARTAVAGHATALAGVMQPMLDQMVQQQYLDDFDVIPFDDRLEVFLSLERATVERLGRLFKAQLGGLGKPAPPPLLIPGP